MSEEDDRAMLDVFRSAGVGDRFARKGLVFGNAGLGRIGNTFQDFFTSEDSVEWFNRGKGWVMSGTGATTAANLMAKMLVVYGTSARVVTLDRIMEYIEDSDYSDFDDLEEVWGVKVLIITNFYDSSYPASPLTPRTRFIIESRLRDRLGNNKSVVLAAHSPLSKCPWWSKDVMDEVTQAGQSIKVVAEV
jgi:hypothetical protein